MSYDQLVREAELDEQDIIARQRYEWPLMRRKIIVTKGQKLVQTFSPHLIGRYGERMGFTLTGIPLIRKFIMNDMINDGIDFDDNSNLLVAVTRNGILLGEAIGGDFFRQHYRTFVTRRMMHETQVEKILTMEALGFDVGEIPANKLLATENALHKVMSQPQEIWGRKEKTFMPSH